MKANGDVLTTLAQDQSHILLLDGGPDAVVQYPPGMGFSAGLAAQGFAIIQPPTQQATRHARRVYVGGLPITATEQSIATFFNHAMAAIDGASHPGDCVINVYIDHEKKFAFVEFRTVEECSNAMALDGIMFEGVSVRVRRPHEYNPASASTLGPSVPNPKLKLGAIGLTPGLGNMVMDASERVFVGGLPYYLTDDQCRELLSAFGELKQFDLVKDRETGNSKGYGFVVYADPSVTDVAISGLNGLKMGERTLTVRRATEGQPRPILPVSNVQNVQQQPTYTYGEESMNSRIVVLTEAVTNADLIDDMEYADIVEDMKEECGKYGDLEGVVIPRPVEGQPLPNGVGKVALIYKDSRGAQKAKESLSGRRFGGRTVGAYYLDEDQFNNGVYD
eukprot:TRINITY_DN13597_c0_g2_i1.p2 TRINITY_DN13597_c0_g2~~TRINITY_DN13597_c0_g2_i1.p2  ORF type:complete len:391 (+),score=53.85 TRINITY_DN13597_c0_g2_i1:34-1206(+)